jgi:DNA repair protein RecN (Recombination protein N)
VLERLSIFDFAVARSVVIEPGSGLNVFTGETGAGKSLVVDALAFVSGGRRGREVIASGAERAVVEASFREGENAYVVARAIGLSGRTAARIDGEPVAVELLQEKAGSTVDIHGQSEQLAILKPAVQLAVLDEFAGITAQREGVGAIVRDLRRVRREARDRATDARERERLVETLRFESEEIATAGLVPGEDAVLREEHARLSTTERRREDVESALAALDDAPIGEAVRAVTDLVARDSEAAELADLAALVETASTDLARGLRRYREAIDEDPERLAAIQERLDLLARLRRKYGETVDDVIAYGARASERLSALTDIGQSLEALRTEEAALLERLSEGASALSNARRAGASRLVRAIAEELPQLGMTNAGLAIGFACEDLAEGPLVAQPDYEVVTAVPEAGPGAQAFPRAFTEFGVDRVEFLASFNAGEAPRLLSAVASGGETSRFLLALTTVLGSATEPRIIVLDEVDEGVGGRAGALVGEALARLARRHQVFCVTHLPQVAAFADQHFVVSKRAEGARTSSDVRRVEGEDRVAELASMLGGVTQANLGAARELLAAVSPAGRT